MTAKFWTDISVLLPRFVLPIAYVVGFVLFDEKMKTRGIYSTIGILPPTIFYFFSMFFGMILSAVYGGTEGLMANDMYGIAYHYFYCDTPITYSGWWWILLWPTIFGVSLMLINNVVFYISRTQKINGKLVLDKKTKPNEDELCDLIHIIKVKRAERKAQRSRR